MLDNTTTNKLHEMRLSCMADAFKNQLIDNSFESLSFEERVGLMVDIEWSKRKNTRLIKLIRTADFSQNNACIEDVEYNSDRKLDKNQITKLSTCSYINDSHNIIVMGASGAGKTYLACAFGTTACRKFYDVKYIRLPDLLNELAVARGTGIFKKAVQQYKKIKLLILDDWLLVPLTEKEARDLLEIIEVRHQKASTIFCSQFATAGWHAKIGEETVADAIMDRIVHDSYTILIDGKESMRKKKGIKT